MVDLEYLGYTRSNLPDGGGDKEALLRTPLYPFDGMNEKGLTVGMMAVPAARAPYDPAKLSLGELGTIRLILDFAATTDEAIALLGRYNLRMEDPPIHYLIADAAGHSAAIEYINGTMSVLKNTEPWHVSTNFIITGSGAPAVSPCWRYNTAYSTLTSAGGKISPAAALTLLGAVSQTSTIWSVVYEMASGTIHVATDRTYGGALTFVLKENLPAE
jgi:predicted choloylglycine hydrolase